MARNKYKNKKDRNARPLVEFVDQEIAIEDDTEYTPEEERVINYPLALSDLPACGPFMHSGDRVRTRNFDIILSMLPLFVWAIYGFGLRTLTLCILGGASGVCFELWFSLILRRRAHLSDALCASLIGCALLSAAAPVYLPVLCSFLTVAMAHAFGSHRRRRLHCAFASRLVLGILFYGPCNAHVPFGTSLGALTLQGEATGQSPLVALFEGRLPELSLGRVFLGQYGGMWGTLSALCCLCAAVYLYARRVADYRIGLGYLIAFTALSVLFAKTEPIWIYGLYQILCGGVLFGILYGASDSASSPVTRQGKWIYGAGCGLLHGLFGMVHIGIESMLLAVVVMNLITPLLDWSFHPVRRRRRSEAASAVAVREEEVIDSDAR